MSKNIKVGYFLSAVGEGLKAGGVAPYAVRILETLLASELPIDYHLFVHPTQVDYAQSLSRKYTDYQITFSAVKQISLLGTLNRFFAQHSFLRNESTFLRLAKEFSNYISWQVKSHRINLIHCPAQTMGAFGWGCPLIITMHDVQELRFPEFFSPRERALRALYHWWSVQEAEKVIVSYSHVKDDLVKYFQIEPEKVYICPIPLNFALSSSDSTICEEVKQKYRLNSKYLLYPAQTWPHKNHIGLLQALAYLRNNKGLTPQLICTGQQNSHYSEIQKEIKKLNLELQVNFLGLVTDEELAALYKMSSAVVIPTLYEAGSFPLMEAINYRVPVICARVTSLPETIGDLRFTFDPTDPIDMASLIQAVLTDREFCEANLANTRKQIELFKMRSRATISEFEKVYFS